MAVTTSLPEPARPDTRELRALELFRSRGGEIRRTGPHTYRVPSNTGDGSYVVDYSREACSCPDHEHRGVNCLHILAVGVLVSKRRATRALTSACDGCGRRFPLRALSEVVESLTFNIGDLLCPACLASSDAEVL